MHGFYRLDRRKILTKRHTAGAAPRGVATNSSSRNLGFVESIIAYTNSTGATKKYVGS